jgi:hypothetical protein
MKVMTKINVLIILKQLAMKKNLVYILLAIAFLGCSSDDEDNENPNLPDSSETFIYMEVNGDPYVTTDGIPVIVAFGEENEQGTSIGFDIESTSIEGLTEVTGITLSFSFSLIDFEPGIEIVNDGLNDVLKFDCEYYYSGINTEINAELDLNSVGDFVRITSLDRENNLISGEFQAAPEDFSTNTTYTITNGVFNKIPYQDF